MVLNLPGWPFSSYKAMNNICHHFIYWHGVWGCYLLGFYYSFATKTRMLRKVIEVQNLYKRYHGPFGGDWVLNVIYTIPAGVSVGVIGANGAGKSTLLRLLAKMDMPDKGKIVRRCSVPGL